MPKAKAKLDGRKAAMAIVSKLSGNAAPAEPAQVTVEQQLVNTDGIIAAIEAIVSSRPDPATIELSAPSVEVTNEIDVTAIAAGLEALDASAIVDKLDEIRKATEANTQAIVALVAVAKRPKVVEYDGVGRIIRVGVE